MAMTTSSYDVKVLGARASPYVNRVQIALNLKSIGYEFIEEPLIPKSKLLLKSNPVYKKVPVLFHGDNPICESLIIVQYVDEAWAHDHEPSILPSNPFDRANAQFWSFYIDNQWYPLLGKLRKAEEDAKAGLIEEIRQGLMILEEAFVNCSKGKDYFGGDRIGYIDISLGCLLGWVRVGERLAQVKLLEDSKVPSLVKWAAKFCNNDAVKGVMPEPDNLIESLYSYEAKFKSLSYSQLE